MRVISGKARGTILHSIEEKETRPTLDRVKESLFNIIQSRIEESIILDLFAGSGAIAIEFLSRGARKAYICEKNVDAVVMINKNLTKTKLKENAIIYNEDYKKCLEKIKNIKFDIIFLDPPYKEDYAIETVKYIENQQMLQDDGIIIIETDEPEKITKKIDNINSKYSIYDLRKYGRASLIFLK